MNICKPQTYVVWIVISQKKITLTNVLYMPLYFFYGYIYTFYSFLYFIVLFYQNFEAILEYPKFSLPGCSLDIYNSRNRIWNTCISPNSFYFLLLCILLGQEHQNLNIILSVPLQPSLFCRKILAFTCLF